MVWHSKDEEWWKMENLVCSCGELIYYEEDSCTAYCKNCGAIIELIWLILLDT